MNKNIIYIIAIFVVVILIAIIIGVLVSQDGNTNVNNNTNNGSSLNLTNELGIPNNKLCGWILKSDYIIKLDLPEKYAHYNDNTIYPSYETGIVFGKSNVRIMRLARKQCKYTVGFSKEELEGHLPFKFAAEKSKNEFFKYENGPLEIDSLEDLPHVIVLKVIE